MSSVYKEVSLYLIFGGIAFFLNIGIFVGIDYFTNINQLINNVICWVICVMFQFVSNRVWVFDVHVDGIAGLTRQAVTFFGGRIFTLGLEEVIIAVFIMQMDLNTVFVKLAAQFAVIVLNYIISKWIVFRK